ncbi:transcription-associated protein 1 [Basidiobolus ranarum]|uniref:Transcription-associated protein 1 n=1 Tax=Basidiobolus ranarum TaxID=34480 RepID=A0ABR2W6C6_9FUNG
MAPPGVLNCEVYATRLADPNLDVKLKVTIALELRDSVEIFQSVEYPRFLSVLMKVFSDILTKGTPVFISNAPEQKLRNTILEIIHRFPQNDALRSYAPDLLKMLLVLLRIENEDNALVCLKVIIDLHRSYKNILEDQVKPILDLVQEMYKNMEQTVADFFDSPGTPFGTGSSLSLTSPRPTSPASDISEVPQKILPKSLNSFKVLTECPIIVVLLFQSYRTYIPTYVQIFIPLIVNALSLQARPQAEAHAAASAKGEVFIGVSPIIKNRAAYSEFIASQVKTMSLVAYFLRGYPAAVRPFQTKIPDCLIRLLSDCPPEASATRKELLVATRHILSTEFRTAFVSKIDILLNEKVLVGTGVTSHETLRPLAYSMLADLIHHVRAELTTAQISRAIYIYSRNLHDPTLPSSIQGICAKLLLNLIDCIISMPNKTEGRSLLIKILDTFTNKFCALNLSFPEVLKQFNKKKSGASDSLSTNEDIDFDRLRPIPNMGVSNDSTNDPVKDGRFIFRSLISGLKTIMYGLRQCNPASSATTQDGQESNSVARGFSQEEVNIFIRLLKEGVQCFDYYNIDNISAESLPKVLDSRIGPSSKEEKDLLDQFANVFVQIDLAVFQEVFTSQMGFLFDQILVNPSILEIPQFFLSNDSVTQNFSGVLLRFLVDRFEKLGGPDKLCASVILRLFKMTFVALTNFPDTNESILQPHIGNIIISSMKLSTKAKEPINYFLLLRALFRHIAGGRYELLYKEVLPLLQVLFEGLNSLLSLAHKDHMRDLFVELCLTVPVRLSVLLPYLSFLMKPLVLALQSGPDLAAQGLRTLELCIDNLTQEFLDPIIAPVMNELMSALWKHLKPFPSNQSNGHIAMRILGKLGGRNRRMLKEAPQLSYHECTESGVDIQLYMEPITTSQVIPLDSCLKLATQVLQDSNSSIYYQTQSFLFIRSCIALLVNLDECHENLPEIISQGVKYVSENHTNDVTTESKILDINGDQSAVKKSQQDHISKGSAKKKVVQESTLQTAIVSLFAAAVIPELSLEAQPFLEKLCRHFALLQVIEGLSQFEKQGKILATSMNVESDLDSNIIVEAIVEVMTSENSQLRKLAENSLQAVYDTCVTALGGKEFVGKLPVFHIFASNFCSCCYKQEWYKKSGGCLGISILSSQLDMGTRWMLEHELEFVKSLLYILKDMSPELATGNIEDATQTLSHVLKVCNRPEDNEESQEQQTKFNNLIGLLISELSNPNSAVRETIQSSFQLLADLTGSEVTELLSPVRERLLFPIFTKPLRALPFAMQIGNIDAITYCLSLRPPFLEVNDELIRLLHEALALADAEDQALVSRPTQHKNASSLTNLRIVCIKLLSAAMACSDFCSPRQNTTRARIISVFFKSLYSKSPEVVEVANKGLKQVLAQQHKLPKDLLQAGLRPILMNLSDHKRLSVAALEGLARLLELLTNYFKVEIGKKLLDHLRSWADPNMLQEAASKPLSENHDIKIIVAILDVFFLLPATANIFLNDLVTVTLESEAHLRRSISSPFRKPLIKFLNRYATEAIDYFYERLADENYSCLFISILNMENASVLRMEVMKNTEKLIDKISPQNLQTPNLNEAQFQCILIVKAIGNYHPEWLGQNRTIFDALLKLWRSPGRHQRLNQEESLSLSHLRETLYLCEVFINYLKKEPMEVDLLFELVQVFVAESVIDFTFLKRFFYEDVALKYTPLQKKAIFTKFLSLFDDISTTSGLKTQALKMVINPMLLVAFTRNEYSEIIDEAMIEQIHTKIWHPLSLESPEECHHSGDFLKIELLQMTTLIIQYASQLITDARKDVIKFGWNFLKLDDITAKQAAYLLIARFIAAYETPSKIIIQIYVALLKAHQSEARSLVRQALDIVTPVLPKRIQNSASDQKFPTWARWTKRVLVEEGQSVSQLVNVYQLLVRHPDLFYDSREHFLPQIVNTLAKLGLLQNSTTETKTLTVDLAELILKWERKALSVQSNDPLTSDNENAFGKRPLEQDNEGSSQKRIQVEQSVGADVKSQAGDNAAKEYTLNSGLRESVISYLIRFTCSSSEPVSKKGLTSRTADLIREFISPQLWSEVHIKLGYFERTLVQMEYSEANLPSICNALEVLDVTIGGKPDDWFCLNIGQLHALLEKCIKSENTKVMTNLEPILVRIYQAVPNNEEATEETNAFTATIELIVQDGLQNLTNLFSALTLLSASSANRPEVIDNFIPALGKLILKLTKDHISLQNGAAPGTPSSDPSLTILIMSLKLMKLRISHLGDQRRWYLTSLIQLIEKSSDNELSRAILDMVTEWVQDKAEAFPTMKEKANLMVTMMCFENRTDKALVEDYLKLVVSIYNDPTFARSELTVRLEQAFLFGARVENPTLHNQFSAIFDRSIAKSLYTRLNYVLGIQNWEYLASKFWIQQALDILLGIVAPKKSLTPAPHSMQTTSLKSSITKLSYQVDGVSSLATQELKDMIEQHNEFLKETRKLRSEDIVAPLRQLLHLDVNVTFKLWIDIFPLCWASLTSDERNELSKSLITLLAKSYHTKQMDVRPNVIQALLESILRCSPSLLLPPQLIKYLGKTYNAWHVAIEILQKSLHDVTLVDSSGAKDNEKLRESTLDAIAELYATLSEDDMYFGLWKRRCLYPETIAAISYEQMGMWAQAQAMYENAQSKARTGALAFSESEYYLWEDHWITCTQKLQQWDILGDLAKHDNNYDLLLDCAWRTSDWTAERDAVEKILQSTPDTASPRRRVFDAFLVLSGSEENVDVKTAEFQRLCDEGIQASLKKWHFLPDIVSSSHIPLLQIFQQFVELQEASQIYTSLAATDASNLDVRSQELKAVLQTWRDRLPNIWDDINVWSDLVAWRRHIFNIINKTYLPLIPLLKANGTSNSNSNSFAYRGYHETAWIINRFAHVARKHHLVDVCINYLNQIYTLPNIEIQEAFLKLREQAKCHFQNPVELAIGLDVINNTNLMYFGSQQKAEFFTLKGLFLSRLGMHEEANQGFSTAIQIDPTMAFAKGWGAWGQYNDQMFKEKPTETTWAVHAVDCYLHAAGTYKNAKSRKFLARILWLLSLDDAQGSIAAAFENYKGEVPVWYWITFIPQLLICLSQREAKVSRHILIKIAKAYPQALHYILRTTKEEYGIIRRQSSAQNNGNSNAQAATPNNNDNKSSDAQPSNSDTSLASEPNPTSSESTELTNEAKPQGDSTSKPLDSQTKPEPNSASTTADKSPSSGNANGSSTRHPWEHVDEIVAILKTAYPLLALSMETMVDQILQRLKPTSEEDIYRILSIFLNDIVKLVSTQIDNMLFTDQIPPAIEATLKRFADTLYPGHIKIAFQRDFIVEKLTLTQYITKLREWRDKFESILDSRPRRHNLEQYSHYLVEFGHQKFDDVEIPGQYLLLKDDSNDFIRIDRFQPEIRTFRRDGNYFKAITIRGHDGSLHPFCIQHPSPKFSRREERTTQFFRLMNCILAKRKESRQRSLSFHLPIVVPLAPNTRLVQDDPSYTSLQEIYEDYCDEVGIHKDDPVVFYLDKLRTLLSDKKDKHEILDLKIELADEISTKMVPNTLLSKYMENTMSSYCDLFTMRKQFTTQMAAVSFMSYTLCIGQRYPHKIHISRTSGNIWSAELHPSTTPDQLATQNEPEPVPFRFTPNIQTFITPMGIEGVFNSSFMAIAQCLIESESNLMDYLCVFLHDELVTWHGANLKAVQGRKPLKEQVLQNVNGILDRIQNVSYRSVKDKNPASTTTTPINQAVLDLVAQASNPNKLSQMDCMWMQWL